MAEHGLFDQLGVKRENDDTPRNQGQGLVSRHEITAGGGCRDHVFFRAHILPLYHARRTCVREYCLCFFL